MDIQAAYQVFNQQLINDGFLIATGVAGVYGRTRRFEDIIVAIDRLVTELALENGAEEQFFPPVVARDIILRNGYMENFPHLCGSIHSFTGGDVEHEHLLETIESDGNWTEQLAATELMLCPATCYPLYPTLTGIVPDNGHHICLSSFVFRHEPSQDPARLQLFRMREDVRVGAAQCVSDWRDDWMEQGFALLTGLGLEVVTEVASDPFFSRRGRMMRQSQKEQALKFELLVPICSSQELTAVASFNYHRDNFSKTYAIKLADGDFAHSACIGFGLERVALALIKKHGSYLEGWPLTVRNKLWP